MEELPVAAPSLDRQQRVPFNMANEEQMSIDELATEALKLSAEDRERLAFAILSSIDEELEYESEWAEEADRRAREIREGRVDTVPGDTVLKEARDRLK